MESYGTVSKDSISLKPLQEQKALQHLEKQSDTKTTDTLSETYGRKSAIITIQQTIILYHNLVHWKGNLSKTLNLQTNAKRQQKIM